MDWIWKQWLDGAVQVTSEEDPLFEWFYPNTDDSLMAASALYGKKELVMVKKVMKHKDTLREFPYFLTAQDFKNRYGEEAFERVFEDAEKGKSLMLDQLTEQTH